MKYFRFLELDKKGLYVSHVISRYKIVQRMFRGALTNESYS